MCVVLAFWHTLSNTSGEDSHAYSCHRAAGFIGSHLAERLAGLGHHVTGLDCLTNFYPRAIKERNLQYLHEKNVPVLPLDLAADDLDNIVQGAGVVYHHSARPGILASATPPTLSAR